METNSPWALHSSSISLCPFDLQWYISPSNNEWWFPHHPLSFSLDQWVGTNCRGSIFVIQFLGNLVSITVLSECPFCLKYDFNLVINFKSILIFLLIQKDESTFRTPKLFSFVMRNTFWLITITINIWILFTIMKFLLNHKTRFYFV